MDVINRARSSWLILLAACLHLLMGAPALADPMYTAIDLGAGSLTFGVDPSGNGTVTGSNGLSYTFNPVQNYLPAQWSNTSQGIPIVAPVPSSEAYAIYGNSNYAFSYSSLTYMNGQGLAAGLNQSGISGYESGSEAFLTQRQADGSWGAPIPLWPGVENGAIGGVLGVGIMGISPNGQVLGYGDPGGSNPPLPTLYLYDTKTQALTNMTSLINSMTWTNSTQLPIGQSPNWNLASVLSQLDNQGRILVQASEGFEGPTENLLLIPAGVSADPLAVPEPATWIVFAALVGGWVVQRRLRS